MDGAVLSAVHVTVEEAVAELPQPSAVLNVLVSDCKQPLDCTGPSVNITVGAPQSAEAVAVPKAKVISAAEGLQPSVGVLPVMVMTGELGALVHITVREVEAVLPQASTAIKTLVCEASQEVMDTVPSEEVMVTLPQPSLAVADPNAAAISEADGLHPNDGVGPVIVITGGVSSSTVMVWVTVIELPQASVTL